MSKKKIVCIFAAYDKNNILKSYVTTYLRYLKDISDYIVFISDCFYIDSSIDKIDKYTDYHECIPHGEYDFGSYKRGISYLIRNHLLDHFDEMILCNDSCLCISPLNDVIKIIRKNSDFGGIVTSKEKKEHIQSFFLLFKSNVFNSNEFQLFFSSVKKEKSFLDVVNNYEIILKSYLNAHGFKDNSVFINCKLNLTRFPLVMLRRNCPLIKKKCFLDYTYSCQSIFSVFQFIRKRRFDSLLDIYDLYNVKSYRELILTNFFPYPNFINLLVLSTKLFVRKFIVKQK